MHGELVEVPCAIEVGDRRQSLSLGNVSISHLVSDGFSAPMPLTIGLRDCRLNSVVGDKGVAIQRTWQKFKVIFSGIEESGRFALDGTLRGVALRILDPQGREVLPGAPTEEVALQEGDMDVRYTLALVGNGEPLLAGEYRSVINYQIVYF